MAGHLAAYVDIPTVSIFGAQNPEIQHAPSIKWVLLLPLIVTVNKMDHWRLCRDCMESIAPEKVSKTVFSLLLK